MWFLPLVVACTGQSVGQSTKYNNTRTSLTWWHRPSPHPQICLGSWPTKLSYMRISVSHRPDSRERATKPCATIRWPLCTYPLSKLVLTRLYLRNLTWGLLLHNLHLHVRFLWSWSFQHRTNNMNHDAAYFHFSSLKLRMEQFFETLLSRCDTVLWHKRFVFDIR